MSLWVTLSSAFTFMRRSARYWPTGVVMMLGTAQVAVSQADPEAALFASNTALSEALTSSGAGIAVAIAVAVSVLGLWLLSELATGVIILAADAPLQDRQLSVADAWRDGRKVWGRVILVDVLVVIPALTPIMTVAALAVAAADSAFAGAAAGILDFLTVGIYSGFAVVLAIVIWAWRDLALRHAVLGGETPMEAIHAAVADVTGAFWRTLSVGAALFVASYLAGIILLPIVFAVDALGMTGTAIVTPALTWQWVLVPGAVLLGPYALFDTGAWTYYYRLLHPSVAEVRDV